MKSTTIVQLAQLFFIPFLIVLIPIIIGHRYGIFRSKKAQDLQASSVGAVVGTAFGLLAFMLAFTFQIAANRFSDRKELLLREVTDIRTTYLRAELIPEPFRSDTKELLTEYVGLRVDLSRDMSKLEFTLKRSQQILDEFWKNVQSLAEMDRSSEIYALFTTSVNDLVDDYNQRITFALEYRIPPVIIWILSIVSFLTMFTLGYQFGITGKGSFWINNILAVVFALVMFLILILDNPMISQINQKPMLTLQRQLQ
jgi:ABC-type multidrug transport system fused ATPase/permease subunit